MTKISRKNSAPRLTLLYLILAFKSKSKTLLSSKPLQNPVQIISQTTDVIPSDITLSIGETNAGVSYCRATKISQKPVKNKAEQS